MAPLRTIRVTLLLAMLAMLALYFVMPAKAAVPGDLAGFLVHNMAPIMFAALVVFLLLGYPVAFALGRQRPAVRPGRASISACSGPTSCRRCPSASSAR